MAQVAIVDLLGDVIQQCRECPEQTMVRAYLRATRTFCSKSRWLQKNAVGVTTPNEPLYVLALDPAIAAYYEVCGIQQVSLTVNGTEIDVVTESYSGGWNPNWAFSTNPDPPDQPSDYQYVPEGRIAFQRTPALAYDFLVNCIVQPKLSSLVIDDTLLPNWQDALEAGTLARLLALARTPWTDKPEAKIQGGIFEGFINQARNSADRGYNAGARTTDRNGITSGGLRTRILPI